LPDWSARFRNADAGHRHTRPAVIQRIDAIGADIPSLALCRSSWLGFGRPAKDETPATARPLIAEVALGELMWACQGLKAGPPASEKQLNHQLPGDRLSRIAAANS
jgi:hypothetical protein